MTTCERGRRTMAVAAACAVAVLAAASGARAQSEDQAAARALFDEGRKLLKAGQASAACPKLEAAKQLYVSAGILLNLADCYEKVGRTASAWTEFGEAATVAKRSSRPEDAQEAKRRQNALEPRLARLTVRVPHAAPGLTVQRDDATLASAAWGAALPVDPGKHSVRAEAPGFEPWTASVTISQPGQVEVVEVPELRALVRPTSPPPPRADAPEKVDRPVEATATRDAGAATPARGGRALPWGLVGGGAILAVGGGTLMLVESSRASNARTNHDPSAYDATRTPWTVGLVGAIVGVVGAAAGATLLAIAPRDAQASGVAVSTWIDGRTGGVALSGSW